MVGFHTLVWMWKVIHKFTAGAQMERREKNLHLRVNTLNGVHALSNGAVCVGKTSGSIPAGIYWQPNTHCRWAIWSATVAYLPR